MTKLATFIAMQTSTIRGWPEMTKVMGVPARRVIGRGGEGSGANVT